ncbi:MAG: O-antigen polymerase, partial [Balneolales bacterium]
EKYVSSPLEVRNTITGIQQNPLVAPPLAYRLGNYMMSVGFVGSILGGILITGTTWKKYMGLLPLVAALIPAILYFSRYVFVNSITFWWLAFLFTSFFYRRERTKKLLIRLFVTSVAVLAFTLSFSYFIFSARNAMWGDFQDAFFETLYVYFAGNIAAFDVFLFEDTALYYGQQTFRTIITWLARLNIWNPGSVHSVHQPFVVISSTQAINTYTFVQTFYGDFGITGTLFLSGLWGAGTRYAVYKYMQKFSFIRLGFVLVMSFSLIMSFYGFYLSNLTTIVFWLVVLYLSDYISGKDVLYSIQ